MSEAGAKMKIRIWDLPTRVFHWLLALAVAGAVVTAQVGGDLMECHGRLGLFIVGLVTFRLVWGIAGSTYARFATFLPGPEDVFAYLKGEWRGLGHNPLGALSVLALLGVVGLQVATGLFANDDIAFEGHLYSLAGKDLSDRLTAIHHFASTLLYGLIGLHVAAIAFHVLVKKNNLVKPMITGWKEAEPPSAAGIPASGGGLAAFVLALAIAAAAVWATSGAWIEEPPPAAASPAW